MSNTKKYEGDIKDLPNCRLCNSQSELEEGHDLLTQEHPYEMIVEEEPEQKEDEEAKE